MTIFAFNVVKIFTLATTSLVLAVIWCPLLTRYLYKHKLWKKEARIKAISGEDAPILNSLHKEREVSVPRFGGLLIWLTVLIVVLIFYILNVAFDGFWKDLNFLSRGQTWLPLFSLVAASIVGLLDDFLTVSNKGKYIGGGMSFARRIVMVGLIGLVGGLWFYFKLDWHTIYIPTSLSIGKLWATAL